MIEGAGKLKVRTHWGAGIGGSRLASDCDYGNIVINCGKMDIQAHWGAGIGSACGQWTHDLTGSITINGGIIESASLGGAGIGSGGSFVMSYCDNCKYSSGNIVINGGNITAYSIDSGAGIGGGEDCGGANVTITGGKVYAYGNRMGGDNDMAGAGIGVGGVAFLNNSPMFLGTLHITGGEVTSLGCEVRLNSNMSGIGEYVGYTLPLGLGAIFGRSATEVNDYGAIYNSADYTADGVPITIADMQVEKDILDLEYNPAYDTYLRYAYKYKGKTSQSSVVTRGLVRRGGKQPGDVWIQSGNEASSGMFIKLYTMNTGALGIHKLNCLTQDMAEKAINQVSLALTEISRQRSSFGAVQNRLEHTVVNEGNIVENTTSAESFIRDTDMAMEMTEFSVKNILSQAGQSMLAQANHSQQYVLSLLS